MNSVELYTIKRGASLKYPNFKSRIGTHMSNDVGWARFGAHAG